MVKIRAAVNYSYTPEYVHQQKDLSVTIRDYPLPHTHIRNINSKVYQNLGLIRRCFLELDMVKTSILVHSYTGVRMRV